MTSGPDRAVGTTLRRLVEPDGRPSAVDRTVVREHAEELLALASEHRVLGAVAERFGLDLPSSLADELDGLDGGRPVGLHIGLDDDPHPGDRERS